MDLLLKHNAVYVSPDYRLLPEAAGVEEVLDDIDDLWKWIAQTLPSIVSMEHGIEVDLGRIFVTGDSAGGYLALQSGLSHSQSKDLRIRAVVPAFPMLDLRAPHFTKDYNKFIFDLPQISSSFIDEKVAFWRDASERPIKTNARMGDGGDREKFCIAVVQRGRFIEFFGRDKDSSPGKRRVHPEDRVQDGQKLPPTFMYHGMEDSAVPVGGTEKFVKLAKNLNSVIAPEDGVSTSPDEILQFSRIPGEHGVGNDLGLGSEKWMEEMESFVEKFWLG